MASKNEPRPCSSRQMKAEIEREIEMRNRKMESPEPCGPVLRLYDGWEEEMGTHYWTYVFMTFIPIEPCLQKTFETYNNLNDMQRGRVKILLAYHQRNSVILGDISGIMASKRIFVLAEAFEWHKYKLDNSKRSSIWEPGFSFLQNYILDDLRILEQVKEVNRLLNLMIEFDNENYFVMTDDDLEIELGILAFKALPGGYGIVDQKNLITASNTKIQKFLLFILIYKNKMHPCGICGCSTRTAAITVGIIASLNYFLQLVVILLHRDFIVAEFSSDQYNVFVFNHFLLLLISLLMLIGGVKESKWALLPFICFVGFQDIISLIVALLSLSELLTSPLRNGVLGLFLVSLLNFLLVTWILWIVTRYFLLLHNGYSQFSVNDEVEVVIEAHYKKNDKIGDRDNEKIEDGNM